MSSRRPVHPFLAAAVLLAGCNPLADENRSATILVASISGGEGEGASGRIYDVVSDSGTVTDEFLDITLNSVPKTTDFNLNPLYRISLQGIEVRYSRLDGRNVPGVDVPFPLRYALGGTIDPGDSADIEFISVTKEAKLQAPLRNLWFGEGQRIFVTMIVTVFGADDLGNQVQASTSTVLIFEDV